MFARGEGNVKSYLGESLNTVLSEGSRHFRVVPMETPVYIGLTIIENGLISDGEKQEITGVGFNDKSSILLGCAGDFYCYGRNRTLLGLKELLQYKQVIASEMKIMSITIDHTNWKLIHRDATDPKELISIKLPPRQKDFVDLVLEQQKNLEGLQNYDPPKDVSLGVLAYTWNRPTAIVEIDEKDAIEPISEKEARFWNAFIDMYPLPNNENDLEKIVDHLHAKMSDSNVSTLQKRKGF